jgi:hypothetical protein
MKPCFECGGIPFRVAIFFVGLTQRPRACHLCKDCHAQFEEKGSCAIPNAARQASDEVTADMNRRKSGPLVPGTRRW